MDCGIWSFFICAVPTDASWVQGMCKCKGKAKSKTARKEGRKEGGSSFLGWDVLDSNTSSPELASARFLLPHNLQKSLVLCGSITTTSPAITNL